MKTLLENFKQFGYSETYDKNLIDNLALWLEENTNKEIIELLSTIEKELGYCNLVPQKDVDRIFKLFKQDVLNNKINEDSSNNAKAEELEKRIDKLERHVKSLEKRDTERI